MGSIIVSILIAIWLAVMVAAALAPIFLNRPESDGARRPVSPKAMPIGDRRPAGELTRRPSDRLAA